MPAGRIYILTNSCIPSLVKIGKTAGSPEIRAKQLSQFAGVPTPFRVVHSQFTLNIHSTEARIFRALRQYRWNHKKEFFHLHPDKAVRIVRTIVLEEALKKPEYIMAKTQLARDLVAKRYPRLVHELSDSIARKQAI